MVSTQFDCLIVGGGPAGLTAAIYAARFRMKVKVIDAGSSRAALIPCTRNQSGFPGGISGPDLLDRMRRHALEFGVCLEEAQVDSVSPVQDGFEAAAAGGVTRARAVILATGVSNHRPPIDPALHAAALAAGRLRYCPVCDGFEVTDQNVAVIGSGAHGVREALFLRSFTERVTLVAPGDSHELAAAQRLSLREAGVLAVDGPPGDFELLDEGLALSVGGRREIFEAVYPALGSSAHNALAIGLGAEVTGEGCIKVDAHQRTSAPGLYAAGDVVMGLDQISHAVGEGAVAATTLRNDLDRVRPFRR
ncbi:MAG TPA: NAD(P)/FAD-dependent oxidoreductase [Caulobacteraceae bacterium]|jgi:thioredoxin reductase (NADPH)|nr:NAD(P)/FAD-dependent oxidoreductase [Caulobacteraceae bacterium]